MFHSTYAGQPIDPHTLGRRLKAIGVPHQLACHASLMDIASELPAVVISRLLGFHQSTGDIASMPPADVITRLLGYCQGAADTWGQ